jgi:hypothetical protein
LLATPGLAGGCKQRPSNAESCPVEIESYTRACHSPECIGQLNSRRVKNRQVVKAGCAWRWWRAAKTLPRVKADVVMIASGRNKPHILQRYKISYFRPVSTDLKTAATLIPETTLPGTGFRQTVRSSNLSSRPGGRADS